MFSSQYYVVPEDIQIFLAHNFERRSGSVGGSVRNRAG